MASEGFSWSGTLEETDIQSLYAACQSLRFSGKLELREGANRADITFVGGEPIEIDGGDTQRIALWNKGTFRALQSIPNLAGELTGQQVMEGSLAITKASQLWAWISEYRLTCDIDLERPGSKAVVSFLNGHAESAKVNDMPELAALARVSAWTDGTFRVRLKPLFVEGQPKDAASSSPIHEGAPPAGRQFDVSRSIPMDLKLREERKLASGASGASAVSFGSARPVTPAPLAELSMLPEERKGRDEPTAQQRSPAVPLMVDPSRSGRPKRSPFDPVEPSRPVAKTAETDLVLTGGRPKLPWLVSLGGIVLAGSLGALYFAHLPPFSAPPKPIVEPSGATVAPSGATVAPSGATTAPSGVAVTPSGGATTPSGVAVAPSGATTAPSGVAVKPSGVAVAPSGATSKPEPPAPKPKPTDKLVAKGRLLLIEGHARQAMDQFRRAVRMAPRDASLKLFEQQAAGKLGKAELVLEGHGAVTIDGHKFSAPKKVKLMAGPHGIDSGDGEDEVTLKRGEKRRIKVKR
jgi:hypothetical protein